jgi:type I restriction enzyme S subunit
MIMHSEQYKYLRFLSFKKLSQWYVEYYLNDNKIHSKYSLVSLRDLIAPKKEIIKKDDYDGILPIVEKITFKTGKVVFRETKTTGMNLYALQQNDLLISNINFHQGATALNTFGNIVASTHYQPYIINLELVRPDYLTMVLRTPFFLGVVSGKKSQGIKNESGYGFIGSFSLPLPQLEEQERLVTNYNDKIKNANDLEHKVSQIEDGIGDYLMKTLGATKKQGKVNRNSKYQHLKFINFIDVAEWGVDIIKKKQKKDIFKYPIVKIKDICLLGSGGTPSRSCPQYYKGSIPWIKTGEVLNEEIFETEEHITEDAIANSSARLYPKGSLIIAMYGQGDTRGRTAKLGIDATTNQACAVLHDIDNSIVSTDYLWYYLQGRYDDLRSLASGNNQPNLNAGKINNYDVVVPPMDVQNEMVAHIKKQKALLKQLKKKAQDIRERALKEFEKEIYNTDV